MRKRTVLKQVWLSRKEHDDLRKKSIKVGLSESSLIRCLIQDFEPKEKPPPKFYDLINELNKIGININQIAHVANMTGKIDIYRYENNIKELKEIIKLIKEKYL